MEPVESDSVAVDGLRVAYRRAGAGPALVLLHGYVGDSREWRGQLDGLADEFTVVAWDAPGAGESDDPPESFRMPDYADCLAHFIAALELERPHVAGLSFGSAVALELAHRHPAVPTSLVLAAAYAGWAGSLAPEVVDERLRQSVFLAEHPPEGIVPAVMPTLFPASTPAERVGEFAQVMLEFHPAGIVAMAHSLAAADLREALPTIDVPTLLLYGDADTRASLDVAGALHAGIPDSKLVVLNGVGHMINVQEPERFNDEVRRFLRSVVRP
ncbi:MAG: alpha/beta fold hydrolase [Thermoleophilaceae bacterium]